MRGAWSFAIREQRGGGTTFRRGELSHIKRRVKVPSSDSAEPSCGLRPARGKFCDVLRESDIWRAGTLMLKRYGDRAVEESASRAKESASAGDDNGVAVWRRITDAVKQLANTIPAGPVH
jgi:hypothetical protein